MEMNSHRLKLSCAFGTADQASIQCKVSCKERGIEKLQSLNGIDEESVCKFFRKLSTNLISVIYNKRKALYVSYIYIYTT